MKHIYLAIYISALFITLQFTNNSFCEQNPNIEIEDQARDISGLLMCPVCEGQSVSESNSQLAEEMKQSIREQLRQGKTKEEILKYFTSRYGDSILATPPPSGINWLIWLLPTLGVILTGLILGNYIYKSQKSQKIDIESDKKDKDKTINKIEKELKDLNI